MDHVEYAIMNELLARLTRIERALDLIMRAANQELQMAGKNQELINALTEGVSNLRTVVASQRQFMQNLADQIEEMADDPDELKKVVETLRTQTDELAKPIVANTPAANEAPAGSTTSGPGAPAPKQPSGGG